MYTQNQNKQIFEEELHCNKMTKVTSLLDEKTSEKNCNPQRGNWASKTEFLLSCAGYAIGIGSVWRFPFYCYRNGGGAFLIPYLLMLFLCGIPLFFVESCLGQFGSTGCITVFKMSPIFKGTGFAMIIVNLICTIYYNIILSYPLLFMAMSFKNKLPWTDCDNPWNSKNCRKLDGDTEIYANVTTQVENLKRTPADEFFHNEILQISSGINEIGGIVWPIFVCNIISWSIVYLCICNGVKSVGKVVYFTATFPFVILFVLFIRGITLPGAVDGILFYIYPEWTQLLNLKVWADAAIQLFFSLGTGWGGIINMSSYNRFKNNNRMDSIFIPILNCGTSIFAGFVVFSVLGYMSHKTGLPISSVATSGPGLAFVTYPEAITMLPFPHLWAILFFFMLYLLGVDSMFVQIEAMITSITDAYPKLRNHKHIVTGIYLLIMFLGSIIFITNAGMYILQLIDWYAGSLTLMLICFVEVLIVGWTYGCKNFVQDVEFMIGEKLNFWWHLCWKYITPTFLAFIIGTTIIFNTRVTYNGFVYPDWAIAIGWCSCLISLLCIPGYMIYYLLSKKGSLTKNLILGTGPSDAWGPADPQDRMDWKNFVFKTKRFSVNSAIDEIPATDFE